MNQYVRSSTELETYMVAAERIKEYTEIETEAEYENEATRPDDTWPHDGVVTYDGYSTRYRPGLDLVLRDVTFSVSSAQKVSNVSVTNAA